MRIVASALRQAHGSCPLQPFTATEDGRLRVCAAVPGVDGTGARRGANALTAGWLPVDHSKRSHIADGRLFQPLEDPRLIFSGRRRVLTRELQAYKTLA